MDLNWDRLAWDGIGLAWIGIGLKWHRPELGQLGLNWDGPEMAPAWVRTARPGSGQAWIGTGLSWPGLSWPAWIIGPALARPELVRDLSHNLRSNFRGHLKLNNPNFYRLIVTTDECFIPLNGKHSLLTIVTHFNFKKNFRSCGKQEFPTICPKWRATRRPFCSGAKWPARMAYLDRIYFWWNKNAFNILWGDNGFCKKHWRVSFDYSHTFCDKKK